MLGFLFRSLKNKADEMSFWEHVDTLRAYLMRSVLAILVFSITAFFFKSFLFDTIIMGPADTTFYTYKILCKLAAYTGINDLCVQKIHLSLINTEVAGQFRYHLLISVVAGIVTAFPIIAWQFWLFIKPALNSKELGYARGMVFYITVLFLSGVLFGYYVIAPLTINFLSNYQLSESIQNLITIGSYISMVSVLSLSMGLVFELPVLIYFLTKIGMLSPMFLRKYRKYAVLVIFIIAGFITPSTDMFSQVLVAIPLWVLYEIGIIISARVYSRQIQ